MKLVIEINMDNAAFEEACGWPEVNRLLEEVMGKLEFGAGESLTLHDINGNTVGMAEVTDGE